MPLSRLKSATSGLRSGSFSTPSTAAVARTNLATSAPRGLPGEELVEELEDDGGRGRGTARDAATAGDRMLEREREIRWHCRPVVVRGFLWCRG
ncbi:hypothetical protein SLA2020_433560 [Shorea laevis]